MWPLRHALVDHFCLFEGNKTESTRSLRGWVLHHHTIRQVAPFWVEFRKAESVNPWTTPKPILPLFRGGVAQAANKQLSNLLRLLITHIFFCVTNSASLPTPGPICAERLPYASLISQKNKVEKIDSEKIQKLISNWPTRRTCHHYASKSSQKWTFLAFQKFEKKFWIFLPVKNNFLSWYGKSAL